MTFFNYQALCELRYATPAMEALAKQLVAEVEAATDGPLLRARQRKPGYSDGIGMCPEIYLLEASTVYRDKVMPFYPRADQRLTITALAESLLRMPGAPVFRELAQENEWDNEILLNGESVGFMRNGWQDAWYDTQEPEFHFTQEISPAGQAMIRSTWVIYRITHREWKFANHMAA